MSSGSYLTIYRKHLDDKISDEAFNAIKDEYIKCNKNQSFNNNENQLNDFPLLFDLAFTHDGLSESNQTKGFCDIEKTKYDSLITFHFGSSFTALKENFNLNPYKFSTTSNLISKDVARQMLQAVEYVLNEKYEKTFEDVLNNEYVEMFGRGYSPFMNRFHKRNALFIDRDSNDSWTVRTDDAEWQIEIEEDDKIAKIDLITLRAALFSFLEAEDNHWDHTELVLEYSVYG